MNPNKKQRKMSNGSWVSTPETYQLKYTNVEILEQICEKITKITNRRVHAIHFNQDKNGVTERIHSLNIVLNKYDEEE